MRTALLFLLASCTSITGGGGTDPVGSAGSGSATAKKPGFSASLTAELSKDDSGSAKVGVTADPKTTTDPKDPKTTDPKTGSADPPKTGTIAPDPKSTEFGGKNDGNHNSVPEPIVSTEPGPSKPSDKRAHVDPGPALGAIKMDMEPNWDRDYETAGTLSFVLKVPNSNDTREFIFHYGYDLTGAPTDREAYKKYLADQKVLNVTLDRQRGAAWYLEGTDGNNNPTFRMEVTFGGKRLVCYGSQYKDKESTAFGPDLRDKVVNTAKKICETLTL